MYFLEAKAQGLVITMGDRTSYTGTSIYISNSIMRFVDLAMYVPEKLTCIVCPCYRCRVQGLCFFYSAINLI
jgi:hypothetical protein